MSNSEFIKKFAESLCDSFGSDEINNIENKLYIALNGYRLEHDSTAISVNVEYDNEWYIKKFLAIKIVNGCSNKTINYYKLILDAVFKKINKHVKTITTDDLRLYLAYRDIQDKVSKTTQDNELRVMRSFWQTLTTEEILEKDITKKINKIKTPKKVKKPFTEYEVEMLRKEVAKHQQGKKYLAIIDVLSSTGCRIGELVAMNRNDLEGDKIIIKGKGNKERYVYLNARALFSVNDYLKSRDDAYDAMFVGYNIHTKEITERITAGAVESYIRRCGKHVGIKKAHPHRFRRTTATLALRRGMPIEQVGRMLGHEQLSTTQIYAKSVESDIARAHEMYLGS